MGKNIGGVAVHAGARIAALAGPAEILVSSTLTELVPGSGFRFEDRGVHVLRGVPGEHHVLALASVGGQDLPAPLSRGEAAQRRETIAPPAIPRRTGILAGAIAVALLAATAVFLTLRQEQPAAGPSGPERSTVVRIDPSTNRVTDRITGAPIGSLGDIPPDIAAGGGAVWVNSALLLSQIDPQTGNVTRITTTRQPQRIIVAHDALWATAPSADLVLLIDPATLQETHATTIPGGSFDRPLDSTLDAVWVGVEDTLVRLDPITGNVTDHFRVGQSVDEMAATPRDLWVVDRLNRTLSRFDTGREQIVETIDLQTAADALAAGEDDLRVINTQAGTLTPIRGGEPRGPIQVGSRPVDLALSEDAVWVADLEDGTVTRVDRQLGRVDQVIDVGAPVGAITVDPSTGVVWAYVP